MKILLADDQEIVREGLRTCLMANPRYEVVGVAEDAGTAVRLAEKHRPDVVIIDIAMPGPSGIEAVRQIISASEGAVRVVVLSSLATRESIADAFRAGVSGYVVKYPSLRELLHALDSTAKGTTYLSPAVADLVIDHYVRADQEPHPAARLTPRERQILKMLAEGHSAKRIGSALDISHKTVHAVRGQVMAKIRAKSAADLIKYALRNGLTELQ
jgi:DNA-binding NarL/FixJ family response regulator